MPVKSLFYYANNNINDVVFQFLAFFITDMI